MPLKKRKEVQRERRGKCKSVTVGKKETGK